MAISIRQSSGRPHGAAGSATEKPIRSTKPANLPQRPPAPIYPAKRRRLNHSAPASESQASAAAWFDTVNRKVIQSSSDFDRDPPFYLDRTVSGPTHAHVTPGPTVGAAQLQNTNDDSENEDLRSVIDDLTVENKNLRQLLREPRQRYDPQLDRDKLFEVRTCGLSPAKKRELEVILTKFVSTFGDAPLAPQHLRRDDPALFSNPCAASEAMTRNATSYPHTDSAYASMSNSGLNSVRQSNKGKTEMQQTQGNKSNNIRSYVDDIPDGSLPKHTPTMSEKSKMRLVVKRLEQLFTGKSAAPAERSQPAQQQKISEGAAKADGHSSHLPNQDVWPEGAREAPILPLGSKLDLDLPKIGCWPKQPPASKTESERSSSDEKSASGRRSPNQRPTRPLDLDIHRAQIAEQNIDYIRHLGLPAPLYERDADDPDDGWVYLNLLINMAQLHTINVTPAFVRNSIAHLSTRFELSKDRRMIRWKGGCKGTESPSSSDSGMEVTTGTTPQRTGRSNPAKQFEGGSGLDTFASAGSSMGVASRPPNSWSPERVDHGTFTGARRRLASAADKVKAEFMFDYKPMFIKESAFPKDNYFCDDSHYITSAQIGDSGVCQGLRTYVKGGTKTPAGKAEDDGPIIYYKNPLFYCDMSGDREAHLKDSRIIPPVSTQILGVLVAEARPDEESHQHISVPGEDTFKHPADDSGLPSLDIAPLSEVVDYGCSSVELSASGIGGVLPDDHFLLQVQRRHQRSPREEAQSALHEPKGKLKHHIEEKIVSTIHCDLPPAKLPPPSYVFLSPSSESSSGLEDDDEYLSVEPAGSGAEIPESDQFAAPAFFTELSTKGSGPCRGTDNDGDGLPSLLSVELQDSAGAADSVSDAERGSDYRGERAINMNTGSRAATVGAGSAASNRLPS